MKTQVTRLTTQRLAFSSMSYLVDRDVTNMVDYWPFTSQHFWISHGLFVVCLEQLLRTAAKLVFMVRQSDHIMSLLRQLHWLRVTE